MLDQAFIAHLEHQLSELNGQSTGIKRINPTGGGCINQTFQLSTSKDDYFLKVNSAALEDMFAAELEGLNSLSQADAFIIPRALTYGTHKNVSYLLMDYVPMSGSVNEASFAEALAQMHQIKASAYGYHRDNYIGSSSQSNRQHNNWFEFFMQERLEVQLRMLADKGQANRLKELWPEFSKSSDMLFAKHQPEPVLLHGDLWQGNVGKSGTQCCLYDPAVYYGDPESDLAMLTLFGHPSRQFYDSYDRLINHTPGRDLRRLWYNLYHVMNHANLFGGEYLNQAENMMNKIISVRNR